MKVALCVFLPIPLTGKGVAYSCGSLAEGMANEELAVTIVTPRGIPRLVPSVDVVDVLPTWTRSLPYVWLRNLAGRHMESAFLSNVSRFRSQKTAAYVWPNPSLELIRQLKHDSVTVFREMVNCHTGTAKRILDQAYNDLGERPAHGITARSVQAEQEVLEEV